MDDIYVTGKDTAAPTFAGMYSAREDHILPSTHVGVVWNRCYREQVACVASNRHAQRGVE